MQSARSFPWARRRPGGGSSAFRIIDVDAAKPLPSVVLGASERGLAMLVRRDGRPEMFVMTDASPREHFTAERLAKLIQARGGVPVREDPSPDGQGPRPTVTVVVCTRSRVDLLERCLSSILDAAARDEAGGVDVLVIDNAPDDSSTRDLVASMPGVRYVMEPLPGLDFARNAALREARGEFLAFVDDDAVVDTAWLRALRRTLDRHPDAAAVTGLIAPAELNTEAQIAFERRGGFRRGFETIRYEGDHHEGNRLYPCGPGLFGAGCNMTIRREAAIALGGFDEALDMGPPLPGGGDLDMFYRILRFSGPLIYEPTVLVFHRHRRDLEGLRRQYWNWGRGFTAFAHKTLRTDRPMRRRMLSMLVWWLGYMAREIRSSARRGSGVRPDLPIAELAGGIVGVTLTYPMAVRRSRRIRRSGGVAPPP